MYTDRTPDELRADFAAKAAANGQPDYDFDEAVTAFCNRKYASDFSQEMTRSAEIYWKEFFVIGRERGGGPHIRPGALPLPPHP